MRPTARVTFTPADRTVDVAPGTRLLDAATQAGVVMVAPCGGRGACGRCAVRVMQGELAPPEERERAALSRARLRDDRIRLSCLAKVQGDVTVRSLGHTGATASRQRQPDRAARVVAGVDLGTTTVVALLVDVDRRMLIASSRSPNRQARFGSDVLSRLSAAQGGASEGLRAAAHDSVHDVLDAAMKSVGLPASALERVVVAANTVMASLFTGANTAGLASHPFRHDLEGWDRLQTEVLAAPYSHVQVALVPPVAAFVGGDLVAGLVAEGFVSDAEGVLFADLGTNAEVAALAAGRAVVTSAPAGPAFEGWGIACGGQQGPGGIVAVRVNDDTVLVPLFEGDRATHLTASGLISAAATLRHLGHLDAEGFLHSEGPLYDRFFVTEGIKAISLAVDPSDREVYLSQLDVRELQTAKAAVAVGLRAVASEQGLNVSNLRDLVITGAFGGALDTRDLVDLGIVPACAGSLTRAVPDAAVRGAADIALDPALLDDACSITSAAISVDLAARPRFTNEFIEATRLQPYDL